MRVEAPCKSEFAAISCIDGCLAEVFRNSRRMKSPVLAVKGLLSLITVSFVGDIVHSGFFMVWKMRVSEVINFLVNKIARDPSERRLTERLYNYWDGIRGSGAYPSSGAFKKDAVSGFQSYGFAIELGPESCTPTFSFVGSILRLDCKCDLTSRPIDETPEDSLLDWVRRGYKKVLETGRPVTIEPESEPARRMGLYWRVVLLPFSEDEQRIDLVVGALNFRREPQTIFPSRVETVPALGTNEDKASSSHCRLAQSLAECRELAQSVDARSSAAPESLYQLLERAYRFHFMAEENPEEYQLLCSEAGIKCQASAPFPTVLKLILGTDHDENRLSDFAACLSYARRNGRTAATLRELIEAMPGGIDNCAIAERITNRMRQQCSFDEVAHFKDYRWHTRVLGEVDDPDSGPSGFVLLLGWRADNGKLRILEALNEKPSMVEPILKRAFKAASNFSV